MTVVTVQSDNSHFQVPWNVAYYMRISAF